MAERTRERVEAHDKLRITYEEREQVKDALRQSNKMEAVGQLTGGLAHDFDNLLTGISGSLELIRTRAAQGRTAELGRYIEAALAAARAAALTHHLLAFARRQTLDPKVIDLNQSVSGMQDLLSRAQVLRSMSKQSCKRDWGRSCATGTSSKALCSTSSPTRVTPCLWADGRRSKPLTSLFLPTTR